MGRSWSSRGFSRDRADGLTPEQLFGSIEQEERKAANEARAYDRGLEACATCGRGVRPGSGWLVEVVDGGGQIAAPGSDTDPTDPGYLGFWVLGPECGRHVPRGFRVRWNGWE